jgi:hypothetical protein
MVILKNKEGGGLAIKTLCSFCCKCYELVANCVL